MKAVDFFSFSGRRRRHSFASMWCQRGDSLARTYNSAVWKQVPKTKETRPVDEREKIETVMMDEMYEKASCRVEGITMIDGRRVDGDGAS